MRPSEVVQEVVHSHVGISDEPSQSSAVQLLMIGDAKQSFMSRLGEDHVAASLSLKDPTPLFKCLSGISAANKRKLRHLRDGYFNGLRVVRHALELHLVGGLNPEFCCFANIFQRFFARSPLAVTPFERRHIGHDPTIFPGLQYCQQLHRLHFTLRKPSPPVSAIRGLNA